MTHIENITPAAIARQRLLTKLPDTELEALIDASIDELNRRAGDPDLKPSEGDLDHLRDDDVLSRLDIMPLPVSRLLTPEGGRHDRP